MNKLNPFRIGPDFAVPRSNPRTAVPATEALETFGMPDSLLDDSSLKIGGSASLLHLWVAANEPEICYSLIMDGFCKAYSLPCDLR
jgi:hypothetical protein